MRAFWIVAALAASCALAIGIEPAAGYSCYSPERVVNRALKDSSQSFFTGTATAKQIERGTSTGGSFDGAEFDVESVWSGPDLSEHITVPYTLNYGSEVEVGQTYHVVIWKDGSANGCTTFAAADYPDLVDGLSARSPVSDEPRPRPASVPAGSSDGRWWAAGVGSVVLLAASLLAAYVTRRNRRSAN